MTAKINYDFNQYNNMEECKRYNGFFDQDGNFYRVNLKNSLNMALTHNTWADKYLKENLKLSEITFNPSYSLIDRLRQITSPSELLVNGYGFVYYSHDPMRFKPIIIKPNPSVAGKRITKEQLDKLFEIMILNNENPFFNPIFTEEEVYEYNGLDDEETRGYSKCKKYI